MDIPMRQIRKKVRLPVPSITKEILHRFELFKWMKVESVVLEN